MPYQSALSLVFLLKLVLLYVPISGVVGTNSSKKYGEYCPVLLDATVELNSAINTFVYRCRHGDDCGGIGDRLAGSMGAAFFSIVSGRSVRIYWPGIEHVFKPGHANWTYDPEFLGIPYIHKNGSELDETRNKIAVGHGSIRQPLADYPQVIMFNDLNTRAISDPKNWQNLTRYQHIYFHSNRGPDLTMNGFVIKKLSGQLGGAQNSHINHYNAYRCIFDDMFQPTVEFLNSTYKAIGHPALPFHKIIEIASDGQTRSLAFHYRIHDRYVATDHGSATIDNASLQWLSSLGIKHQTDKRKLNLFFITNSPASAAKVLHDSSIKAAFKDVYCQELTGSRHTNSEALDTLQGHTVQADSATALSFQQAMRDWWIIRVADVMVCGKSGFCRSAGLVASENQIKYDEVLKRVEVAKTMVCSNRECV